MFVHLYVCVNVSDLKLSRLRRKRRGDIRKSCLEEENVKSSWGGAAEWGLGSLGAVLAATWGAHGLRHVAACRGGVAM